MPGLERIWQLRERSGHEEVRKKLHEVLSARDYYNYGHVTHMVPGTLKSREMLYI